MSTSATTVEQIEQMLANSSAITRASLGGSSTILQNSAALAASPHLDVLAALVTEGSDSIKELDELLIRALARTAHPTSLREAMAVLFADPTGLVRLAVPLQKVLLDRVESKSPPDRGLIRAYALEAAFQMALAGVASRHRPLAIMIESPDTTDSLYAEHIPRLIGAAYAMWSDPELVPVLKRLRERADTDTDATFELGLVHLRASLDRTNLEDVIAELRTAEAYFRQAAADGDAHFSARAYASTVELVQLFARAAPVDAMALPLADLRGAIRARASLVPDSEVRDWLHPRIDRELQWYELLSTASWAAERLAEPSWLDAASVLSRLLSVYVADRTVGCGPGLAALWRPVVAAAFVRERGLLAHLDELLRRDEWSSEHGDVARKLREAISHPTRPLDPAKLSNDAYPLLRSVLNAHELDGIPASKLSQLESQLDHSNRKEATFANPVLQRILKLLRTALRDCADYAGATGADFDELIMQVLAFCADRQDAQKGVLGARGAYLTDPGALEFDLQQDLRQFLVGNLTHADVRVEVADVATGRADLYLSYGSHRFIIELKREFVRVDRPAARRYANQAAAYQNTNVKLGLLGILDLSPRDDLSPAIEECVWHDIVTPVDGGVVRHLVVFRVPGNRISPSAM